MVPLGMPSPGPGLMNLLLPGVDLLRVIGVYRVPIKLPKKPLKRGYKTTFLWLDIFYSDKNMVKKITDIFGLEIKDINYRLGRVRGLYPSPWSFSMR